MNGELTSNDATHEESEYSARDETSLEHVLARKIVQNIPDVRPHFSHLKTNKDEKPEERKEDKPSRWAAFTHKTVKLVQNKTKNAEKMK